MDFENIQYGITEKNLGVLIFVGVPKPTREIKNFIADVPLVEIFSLLKLV